MSAVSTMAAREMHGIGVGSFAAIGPVRTLHAVAPAPADEPTPADEPAFEAAEAAIATALAEVSAALLSAAARQDDPTAIEVLEATAEIAADPELVEQAAAAMGEGIGPANAVTKVFAAYAEMFLEMDGYMAERVADLHSVRDRVVARLLGWPEPGIPDLDRPSVITAEDLTPADTLSLELANVLALVTEAGGPTSHTAIIARQLGVPCLVRTPGVLSIPEGTEVAVDAARGTLVVDPDEELRADFREREARWQELREDTAPGATADGHRIQLLANIGTVEDARAAAGTAVEGVGLFRTEFLFLGRTQEPSVEEQAEQYREVLRAFDGRKVVIRTLDAGADKPIAFAGTLPEANPALGVRAYRLSRRSPQVLRHQLEALARAIADLPGTDVQVMAPMISTPAEAQEFHDLATECGIGTVGVMVEVPAAALSAEHVLAPLDFASIGTNDLAQYTMASDRELGDLADLIDRWQPAILQLIERTARAGATLGRPVGVCGESAADPCMALVLCGLGVTSLSMSAAAVPHVRYALRRTDLATCQEMARAALSAPDATQARRAVVSRLSDEVREALLIDPAL